jgi:glycosyltransferase involved in cell wall biosynthesis
VRVLVLSHLYPRDQSDWTGIFVFEQVRALRQIGIDARAASGLPHWLSEGLPYHRTLSAAWRHIRTWPAAGWHEREGVPCFYFPWLAPDYPPWLANAFDACAYRRGLKAVHGELAAGFAFDVVHAHTALRDGTAAAWLADRYRIPMVLTEHTGPFSLLTSGRTMRRQTERAIDRADRVLAVSAALQRDISQQIALRRPERLDILGNGIDARIFRPEPCCSPQDGTVHALWIGGMVAIKQPLMLLEAFAMAFAQLPKLRLTMVGDGALQSQIEAAIASRGLGRAVRLKPSISHDAVAEEIRRHHFLVIASASETFGVVAVEALACGRPVLTTRCGGPEETVRDRSNGEIVENSCAGLAAGFLAITARLAEFDPHRLHQEASARFDQTAIALRLAKVYEELITERKAGAR